MSMINELKLQIILQGIFSYKNNESHFDEQMLNDIVYLVKLARSGTHSEYGIKKLERLRALLSAIFRGSNFMRLNDKDFEHKGEEVYVRCMMDGECLCYIQSRDLDCECFTFLTCTKMV